MRPQFRCTGASKPSAPEQVCALKGSCAHDAGGKRPISRPAALSHSAPPCERGFARCAQRSCPPPTRLMLERCFTVLGAATMLSSLGMALGPLLGGWLYDRYGSYAWLYLGSLFVGLAAAGIAMTFPRTTSR